MGEHVMGQLDGKVALVTGGSAGIGLETARRFAAEGAQVYLTGRRKEVLDAAVADIEGDVTGVVGDVSDLAALDTLFDAIKDRSGGLDVLVANAGGGRLVKLGEFTEEHYDTTFDSFEFSIPAASPYRASATNRRASPTPVGVAMATRSHTIGYATRARMMTRPDPIRAPNRGSIDAPIRLVIPKTVNSIPNV
jgi:NAD(P)-dependent dehydrogenase (short-subunit alcohol dehydrogenase family)